MKMIRRRHGSQRASEPIPLRFEINFAGQGGSSELTFYDVERKMYYIMVFETEAEVRELLSQAHIIHHNFPEAK